MKSFVVLFLLLFPMLSYAQIDPKYGPGKVPVVGDQVVFTREIELPGITQEQIYDVAHKWASNLFVPVDQFQSRILTSDKDKGLLSCLGQQNLVFTSKLLSLDQAIINYQMRIVCISEKCHLKISTIQYFYDNGKQKERISAEEQIVDEIAFNKKQDKMLKIPGKFRIQTINLVEDLFNGLEKELKIQSFESTSNMRKNLTEIANHPEKVVSSLSSIQESSMPGYKQIHPERIPGNIYKLLADHGMLIGAGTLNKCDMVTANWGGIGRLFDKPITFCFIQPNSYTFQFMENNETYTLCFFTEVYRDALTYCEKNSGKDENKIQGSHLTPIQTPSKSVAFSEAWMIIECKKLAAEPISPEGFYDSKAKEEWKNNPHKMYIGEIIHVWVK